MEPVNGENLPVQAVRDRITGALSDQWDGHSPDLTL